MGRKKIPIKKLEATCQRRTTFRRRYNGVSKKAHELSTLCDIPVLLVTSTTSGGYNVFVGQNRHANQIRMRKPLDSKCSGKAFSNVVQQYVNESKENLAKTKRETIKSLFKSCTDGHVVNVNGKQPIEGEEYSEMRLEKTKQAIAELEHCLGPLRNLNQLEKVETIEEVLAMEASLRYLIAQNKETKAHTLEQRNACFEKFSTSCGRDPRCSTSTPVPSVPAIPTVPMPSNHISPLYGSSNPTGSMQLNGPTYDSGSNPTGRMQLHGLAVGSERNLTGSMLQHGPTFGSSINLTESMQQHGPTFGSGINLTESMQQHGPISDSGTNPTGSVRLHRPTARSDTAWYHGPQNLSRNMPERADFQDSNSVLDPLKVNLSEGAAGPDQYMQDGDDEDTIFNGLTDLPNSNNENYGSLYI